MFYNLIKFAGVGNLLFFPCILLAQNLQSTMMDVIGSDSRNTGIDVSVSVRNESELIFDLRSISGENSSMDVFRVFLQFASVAREQNFSNVFLAFGGNEKFVLSGSDFRVIGLEFGEENVIYTLRTFPEKLSPLDGKAEFPTRQGGVLYVAQAQMQDFTVFNERWFLGELKDEFIGTNEEDTRVYDDDNAL